MTEPIKLQQTDLLGTTTVFIIIPFSTGATTAVDYTRPDFGEWYVYGQEVSRESSRQVRLTEPLSESLLRQLLDKDQEIYHEAQIKKNPFTRGLITQVGYANEALAGVDLKILVTYHSDGIGTAVLINTLPSMTVQAYFEVIKQLQEWWDQPLTGVAPATMQAYLSTLFRVEKGRKKEQVRVTWGEEYPFFSLGGAEVPIGPLQEFVENNKAFVYGMTHQDYSYSGWQRIRDDVLDTLLDRDLSRRKEYSLYLTDVAMLEIDGDSRRDFIATWAKRRNTTEGNMRIKLLFERVQLLELLLTQRFILQDIEANIQEYDISAKTPIHQLVQLKNKINAALSDYYYANTMTRQHVSGIEWVTYGQRRLHLEELLEHIKNRMELIESSQQIKNDFNNMRGNYTFQLISILLGSSAVVSVVDVLIQFPFLEGTWFAANALWVKGFVYILFLVVILILTIRYSKDR